MKKKELKEIANKIAKAERTIATSSDKQEIANAKAQIFEMSSKITDPEDFIKIDELVQDLLDS